MKTLEELESEMDATYATYIKARKAYYKAVLDERHAKNFADMNECIFVEDNGDY